VKVVFMCAFRWRPHTRQFWWYHGRLNRIINTSWISSIIFSTFMINVIINWILHSIPFQMLSWWLWVYNHHQSPFQKDFKFRYRFESSACLLFDLQLSVFYRNPIKNEMHSNQTSCFKYLFNLIPINIKQQRCFCN
jgi:hypothetical protein